MIKRPLDIINKLGLHARAASKFVKLASRFESDVRLRKGEREANGKSIMGVMMLAAEQGAEVVVAAEGEDEIEAVEKLAELLASNFEDKV